MVISLSESSGSILDDTLATNIKIISKERYNYTFKALETVSWSKPCTVQNYMMTPAKMAAVLTE